MLSVSIDRGEPRTLVDQIVDGLARQLDGRAVGPGSRLPSIRKFAETHGVSRFTVVEAYDRLVALGYLEARAGAGFFATARRDAPGRAADPQARKANEELVWLIRRLLEAREGSLLAGGPWLPNAWLDEMGIRRSLATLARRNGAHLVEYGDPLGYRPLREQLALLLEEQGIVAPPSQIVLTHGASQALDLVIRYFVKPGDAVLVDDPGYYNLFGDLRLHGAELVGVPRGPDGADVEALEALARAHRPRIYFTQSALQNPTGTDMSPHVGFRVLQLAERYDFRVVEDDIFSDFQTTKSTRLAALDRLDRVIYVRSFSKTVSGSLRVGFLVANQSTANDLLDVKMLSSITTSQVVERVLYALLVDGQYRKFLTRLNQSLGEARARATESFRRIGLELFAEPEAGMFLWARFPHVDDAVSLVGPASREGIVLAPGTVFRPRLEPSPWMRFNVATCDDPRLLRWLEAVAAGAGREG